MIQWLNYRRSLLTTDHRQLTTNHERLRSPHVEPGPAFDLPADRRRHLAAFALPIRPADPRLARGAEDLRLRGQPA